MADALIPTIVRRVAADAIRARLGPGHTPAAIIGLYPAPNGRLLLHVNSGGNAEACRLALLAAGYDVADTDYDPFAAGNYGVRLWVSARPEVPA